MSGEHKRKLRAVQKATDKLNLAVHRIEESEKYYLDMAATHHNNAINGASLPGVDVSWYLQREEWCQETAKEFTDMRDVALHDLAVLDILKTREIETFQQQQKALTASQKTSRLFSFFF